MKTQQEYEEGLVTLRAGLSAKQLKSHGQFIDELRDAIREIMTRCWWLNPSRKAAVSQAMRDATRARRMRIEYHLYWRTADASLICKTLEEAARHAGRSPKTLDIYLSRGKGVRHFAVTDGNGLQDSLTVRKVMVDTWSEAEGPAKNRENP